MARLDELKLQAGAALDEAVAIGAAGGGVDPTPFSQADLDKAVADAVAPLQAQVDGIPAQLDALKVSLKASVLDLVKNEEADMEGKLASL